VGRKDADVTLCNQCARDTFYCKHRTKAACDPSVPELRRTQNGGLSPTSYNQYGNWTSFQDPENAEFYVPSKPIAGRVANTKQFYDSSHLNAGFQK
jgi:hypothetical protein